MSCPNGLPANLSGLSALHTLDLAFNILNSPLDQVAQVRVFDGCWQQAASPRRVCI